PLSPVFPYTTLFRSHSCCVPSVLEAVRSDTDFLGLPDVAGLADFFTVDGHGDRPCVAEPEANLVVDRVVLRFALGEETDEEVLTLGVLYLDPAAVGRGEAHEHFAWFLGLLGDLVLAHRLDGDVFVHAGRGVRGVLAVTEELERGTQRVGGLALPGTYAHEEAQKDHDHDQGPGPVSKHGLRASRTHHGQTWFGPVTPC